jgi:hypothetical protein
MTAAAGRDLRMASKRNWLDVAGICLLFILLSLVGIIWDVASGLLTSGIDGIMLAAVCLMTAGIFALMLLVVLHQAGLLPKFGKPKAEVAAASAKPAAPAVPPAATKPAAPASVAPASPATATSAAVPKPAAPPRTEQGK